MFALLTATKAAAAASVRIWRFTNPSEFGADGIETQTARWHELRIAS
jgi:hypothetical protein